MVDNPSCVNHVDLELDCVQIDQGCGITVDEKPIDMEQCQVIVRAHNIDEP